MIRRTASVGLFLLLSTVPGRAWAADYNIRLLTDSTPDITDSDSYVRSITENFRDPQEKAIAIWRWGRRTRHQTRCATERGRLIWDPILHMNSYGYMNCGIISALNIAAAMKAGFRGRYIQLGDHTVSEMSWDGGASWHLFDSSMSVYCYNHDGAVASCEEIKGAAYCGLSGGKSESGHFYYYHPAPPCASHLGVTGWRCASDNPVEYRRTLRNGAGSYTDGYSVSKYSQMAQWGRRYILNLKPHQAYTRYWKTVGTSREHYRVARGEKDPGDLEKNAITRTVRANGVWEFRPDLSAARWEEYVYDHENLKVQAAKPHFVPRRRGETCRVVFKVDGANVITSMKVQAEVECSGTGSRARLMVSRDAGLAWQEVWRSQGKGEENVNLGLVDEVAGHTEALVKFEMTVPEAGGVCGLAAVQLTTTTQVNRLTLPRLVRGRNRIQLRVGEPVESLVLWPVLHGGAYKETICDEKNIYCRESTDSFYKATLGAARNNVPCRVTWRLATPGDVVGLTVGARVCNRGSGYVSLLYSWDGKNFRELFRKSDGSAPFDLMVLRSARPPAPTRSAWVRCEFFTRSGAGTYNAPGIQDLLVRASHRPRSPLFQPLEVTYCWTEHHTEGDITRRQTKVVGSPAEEWGVSVGGFRDPTMQWVRLQLQGEAASAEKKTPGDSDGVEATGVSGIPNKVVYRWGTNLARNASYTSSRPACQLNGDGGAELTNGIVVPPTDYFTSEWPEIFPSATAGWDGEVAFDVDLKKPTTVSGARICTHQPNARYCHPARVEVHVSTDGKAWKNVGRVRHDDLWDPPADYEPWEYDDDPAYASLPAGGRLAYAFPLVFKPTRARYVRFELVPLPGKGIGVSELQVFGRVDVVPWPNDIALPRVSAQKDAR